MALILSNVLKIRSAIQNLTQVRVQLYPNCQIASDGKWYRTNAAIYLVELAK